MLIRKRLALIGGVVTATCATWSLCFAEELPRSHDPPIEIALFAENPDIVHPVAATFDDRGRLLVIESHTHFPPTDYEGLEHDRVRAIEDTDGDGRADRFTTFFQGTRASMDLATHPDGSIYLATRNEILRLRDTTGDGRADEKQRIVFLETEGNYPHNGLSGLAFDLGGDLYFGLGENLGAAYTLRGSDGREISDEGEGGNVFWCRADGSDLRRVATGFWNPFGVHVDPFGRVFAVDNDPDSSPPCRLMQVIEGGDYGYQFRYGRSGRHPFQSWNGSLPGALPMMAGVGEAPCEVLMYESDGLPDDYRGELLVTSWAEHRLERYTLKPRGASYTAERKPFISGGTDFRPVGLVVAPDGSLFLTDWVLRDYKLHGRGRIWHVRMKERRAVERPDEPWKALSSKDRRHREAAARTLAAGSADLSFLRRKAASADVRQQATALATLAAADDTFDLADAAENTAQPLVRRLAVHLLAVRGAATDEFAAKSQPAEVQLAAIPGLSDAERLAELLVSDDPFLRNAAIARLAANDALLDATESKHAARENPQAAIGLLLAHVRSASFDPEKHVPRWLESNDPQIRFLAIKCIADRRLSAFRPQLDALLSDADVTPRLYFAAWSALNRLEGKSADDRQIAGQLIGLLAEPETSAPLKIMALRLVPPDHKELKVELLAGLAEANDRRVMIEAVRTLAQHPHPARLPHLARLAADANRSVELRAEALVGLAAEPAEHASLLLRLTSNDEAALRTEAARALIGVSLTADQAARLKQLAGDGRLDPALVARLLTPNETQQRPADDDLDAWQQRLEGPADPAAGRRIFFHPRLVACFRCHRANGRGSDVGPDLTELHRVGKAKVLEGILQPSKEVAPHFQSWALLTDDGKLRTGLLLRTHLDEQTYLTPDGNTFQVNTQDILERKATSASIMPEGLVRSLTDQELRDLLAFLTGKTEG